MYTTLLFTICTVYHNVTTYRTSRCNVYRDVNYITMYCISHRITYHNMQYISDYGTVAIIVGVFHVIATTYSAWICV